MSSIGKLKNKYFVIIDFILIFLIGIMHFVFSFYIEQTDFQNIFDAFESSPLFDFSVSNNCGKYSHIVFHIWEGRKETEYYRSNGKTRSRTKILDKKEIDRINGYYFCYEYKSYKELLYNGQIIKKEEECPTTYPKDCGIIDTLNQHLCIKNEENCPLYDVGIIGADEPTNKNNYIYNTFANIYYNDNKYKTADKKIIGKIILNDGQPCYRLNEKLWKKFSSKEVGEEHLKCELEIFGVTTDNRYQRKGDITYNKLYEILDITSKDMLKGKINDNEYVSLYIREFLGIDKACDEKKGIKKEDYEKLKNNQEMEAICVIVEAIIIFGFLLTQILFMISALCKSSYNFEKYKDGNFFIFLFIILLLNLICIICQSVFLGRIIKYDLAYDCSDEITNEVLRKENINTKKSIKYTAINLGFDIFYILFNIFAYLIAIIIDKIKDLKYNYSVQNSGVNHNNKNNYSKNSYNKDKFNKEPAREVIVNNVSPYFTNQYNNPMENNLNQNIANNTPNPYPVLDLGVPPPIEQGYTSKANL